MNGLGLTNFIYINIEKIIHIFPGEQHQQIVKTNKISNS
jgi:Tfp pilus assembly ATPase PilU